MSKLLKNGMNNLKITGSLEVIIYLQNSFVKSI